MLEKKQLSHLNYKIPADISSRSFFIVLTALSNKSKLTIKDVNINPSRVGVVKILKKMGVKIFLKIQKYIRVKKLQIFMLKVQNF